MEQVCRATGNRVLVSCSLLMRAAMPLDVAVASIGKRLLRGKSERVALFALRRREIGEESTPYLLRACA
jgi:class 3 adenylate cyclase